MVLFVLLKQCQKSDFSKLGKRRKIDQNSWVGKKVEKKCGLTVVGSREIKSHPKSANTVFSALNIYIDSIFNYI